MNDCGISCGSCPLAGLCGDPVPAPRTNLCGSCDAGLPMRCTCPRFVTDAQGVTVDLAAPPVFPVTRLAGGWLLMVENDPELGGEQLALFPAPSDARFVVDAQGVTADRYGFAQPETWEADAVDPDAPDVDPNEPRPADAGCCGGRCAA